MRDVVNVHVLDKEYPNWRHDPQYVYIGRAGKGLRGEWGNPFVLGEHGDRAEVILKYMDYTLLKVIFENGYLDKIRGLKGKTLVCFCSPSLCHGHILALLAELV